jgi:hypothetical protein
MMNLTTENYVSMPNASRIWYALRVLVLLAMFVPTATAMGEEGLPPRAEWRASSTSTQVKEQRIEHLIDGDAKTRTGGSFSAGHWFQVDLGRVAQVAGARITWEHGPQGFLLKTSTDGATWDPAYRVDDSLGGVETGFFAPRRARYLRMESLPITADWGVSVFELEPLGTADAAKVRGLAEADDGMKIWQADDEAHAMTLREGAAQLEIELLRPLDTAGLMVDWAAGPRGAATLEARDASGAWRPMAADPFAGQGENSYLAARASRTVSALRLRVDAQAGQAPAIRRVRLLGPGSVLTPMKRYQIAAERGNKPLFPASLHMQQTYWTALGIPAGRQKSIFDEYGNLEAFKGAPLVQAVWRDAQGAAAAADGHAPAHALRDGWMPMPSVRWTAQPGVEIVSEAFAVERGGQPVTLLRHRIANTGKQHVQGKLFLLVRPMQMNPPWQNGGVSPIDAISIEGGGDGTSVRVNGRTLLTSLSPVEARGAAPFGEHGEREITRFVAAGEVPDAPNAQDADGLAAGALRYDVDLAPGAHRDVVVAFPLGTVRADAKTGRLPEAPVVTPAALMGSDTDAGRAYDRLADEVARQWAGRFGRIGVSLPDRSLVDMLRAQGAYMLINQTGHAMQPGPRNYNRAFIRDGAATAAVLLRMGQIQIAREFLRWYTEHAVRDNGLVSPILHEDGSNWTGYGSDIEYDAQGQYIGLVADVARLDGGPESVRDYLPQVKRAMQFLQALRERTLVPGYMADQPAPERFRGILAPSISHEGYASPTHSYWDNFFALQAWRDGAWLAEALGDAPTAAWAREQGAALRKSLTESILATMRWKGDGLLPADADTGGQDPTSISIALDPTGAQDVLPADALQRTYARYIAEVRAREQPGALYAYTPYELRNVLTYVHLDQPQAANELLSSITAQARPREWHVFAEVIHSRLRFPRYMGDMPHTWIGAEFARAIYGMLLREEGQTLHLLPGAPESWLMGSGVGLDALPTAYGPLTLRARREGATARFELGPGIQPEVDIKLSWPRRERPVRVLVDGRETTAYDARGIELAQPFRTLVAEW